MLTLSTSYGQGDRMSQRFIDFYTERARGGVGLIIAGIFYPANLGVPERGGIGILYKDESIPGLRDLTGAVHAHGAKIAAQLCLQYEWRRDDDAPLEFVAPSEVVTRRDLPQPRALSGEEVAQIVEQFGGGGAGPKR
jgi:2,4-dienoyl-CoA reductase (NADPH2)